MALPLHIKSTWSHHSTPGGKKHYAFCNLVRQGGSLRLCLIDGQWKHYTSITEVRYKSDGTVDKDFIDDYIKKHQCKLVCIGITKELVYPIS